MTFSQILRTSRPRFWIYLAGPFLVGYAIVLGNASMLTEPLFWIFGIYFTFPANLFLYGINDIHDYETDKHNPKKKDYEQLLSPEQHYPLLQWIVYSNIPFLFLSVFLPPLAQSGVILFFLLGWQYSAPPIRAKTIPLLDSTFNVLYILPGVVSFFSVPSANFSWDIFLAAMFWAMAMHAYSAIPDIETDRTANIQTVGTLLGINGTLIFCTILYGMSYILVLPFLSFFAHVLGIVYMGMMLITSILPHHRLTLYTFFPWINTIMGFLLFWYVFI